MNKTLMLLAAFAAAAFAGQITLKNGDRVTGSIVKKDKDALTVKTVHFGTVTLPWSEVASLVEDTPVNVSLSDGRNVQGTLAEADGKVTVKPASGAPTVVEPVNVVTLRDAAEQKAYERLQAPRFQDLWVIAGSLNIAGTSGNAKTSTFTTPWNATRVTRGDKTTLYFNSIRATATVNDKSAKTAQAVRGGWAYNRNIRPRVFWNSFNDYEYDRFQSLDLRVVLGTGLGYAAWRAERGRLDLLGGAAYNREKFDPARPVLPFTRNSAEAYWGDDFSYRLSSRVNFIQSYRMFNNLTTTGVWRQNLDAGISASLTKWLTWNASISDRYLSRPAPGRLNNDFLYTTGFGFSFAR
mgnify:CR=1 FL=1